jgi:hypothetical protein
MNSNLDILVVVSPPVDTARITLLNVIAMVDILLILMSFLSPPVSTETDAYPLEFQITADWPNYPPLYCVDRLTDGSS